MKFILIIFFFTANPSDNVGLAHRAYNSEAQCLAARQEIYERFEREDVRMGAFCVSEEELVTN